MKEDKCPICGGKLNKVMSYATVKKGETTRDKVITADYCINCSLEFVNNKPLEPVL